MSTPGDILGRIRDPAGWYPLPDDPSPQTPWRGNFGVGSYPPGTPGVVEAPPGVVTFSPGIFQGNLDVPTGVDARNVTIENFYSFALDFQAGASYFKVPPYTVCNFPIDITYLKTLESLNWQIHTGGVFTQFQATGGDAWRGPARDGRTIFYTLNDNTFQSYSIFDRGVLRPVTLVYYPAAFPIPPNDLAPYWVEDNLPTTSRANPHPEFWVHGLEIQYENIPAYPTGNCVIGAMYTRTKPDPVTLYQDTGVRVDETLRRIPVGSGTLYVETPGLIGLTLPNSSGAWNGHSIGLAIRAWTLYD